MRIVAGIEKAGLRRSNQASWILAFCLGLACLLVSCAAHPAAELRVGVDNAPPYHIIKADGSVEGLAVDVLNEAARRRHIRIVWVPMPNTAPQDALAAGKVDAWPAMSRTPERDRLFHFTAPWLESNYYVVTRAGAPLHAVPPRVAVASYGRIRIVASRFLPGAAQVLKPTHPAAIQAFCTGLADAALIDARSLDVILLNRPEGCGAVSLHLEYLPAASNPVSIASLPAAAEVADSLLKGIMTQASDGTLWASVDRWTGFSAAQTRSFFALREAEGRRDFYLFCLAAVTLSVICLGWAFSRLRVAQRKAREAQLAAGDSEARFHAFMDHSPLVGFIKDEHGRMLYQNRRYLEVFGLKAGDCLGRDDFQLWPREIAEELRRNDLRILTSGETVEFIESTPVRDGESITWLSLKFPFRRGSRTYLGGMCVDITERERAEEALRLSEERFRSLFSHATVGIAIADPRGAVVGVNAAFCRILRLEEKLCLSASVQALLDDAQQDAVHSLVDRIAAGIPFETRHERNGSTLWTENCVFAVKDTAGQTVNIVVIAEDITQRKLAEAQLAHQARHDLLTGLPNRRTHEKYLEEQIARARHSRRKFCLLYVDLDDFKIVNDTLGHEAGDLVLQEAARRLSSLVADSQSLSRIGGDEFVIVQNVEDRDDATALASRLRLAMEQPFEVGARHLELRASAGFSLYPDDALDARSLRKKADDAMYAAKRLEKSARFTRKPDTAASLEILSAVQ